MRDADAAGVHVGARVEAHPLALGLAVEVDGEVGMEKCEARGIVRMFAPPQGRNLRAAFGCDYAQLRADFQRVGVGCGTRTNGMLSIWRTGSLTSFPGEITVNCPDCPWDE